MPAANKYTKVFPTVARICLQLQFYNVFKKAIRICVGKKQRGEESSDEELRDPNALVGAPVNTMAHHRKLQAKQKEQSLGW